MLYSEAAALNWGVRSNWQFLSDSQKLRLLI